MKFSKKQIAKIHAIMRRYNVPINEAVRMYVQRGF
jgi:hypothetical protein